MNPTSYKRYLAAFIALLGLVLMGLVTPAQAEGSSQSSNWEIAKANVERFLGLDSKALAALFKRNPARSECNVELDDNTILRFYAFGQIDAFAVLPHDAHSMEGSYGEDPNYEHPRVKSEAVWTGAKRRDEKEYWTIIKNNLDKFMGMTKEQILSLLGPERESSIPWNYIRYRVGDSSLTFFLKDGKVEKYRFQSDTYIPGT
jgi:hypothetical protein